MKYYLIIVVFLISLGLQGQIITPDPKVIDPGFYGITSSIASPVTSAETTVSMGSYDPFSGKLHYKYDTIILYKGIDTSSHDHDFVSEKQKYSVISCAVMHGLEGCDWYWMNKNEICVLCLRHINIKETRWVEPVKDKYLEALDRLNKIKKQ